MTTIALGNLCSLQMKTCELFGTFINHSYTRPIQNKSLEIKPLIVQAAAKANSRTESLEIKPLIVQAAAKANSRTESAKLRNRRIRKKFNGTPEKPRLSVFCSEKQLYATLVDDQNKKSLFYGSTLQKSIRGYPPCNTVEAAERVGEKLVQTCVDLNIHEISSYDCNGFARGERMQAFEISISRHGFLPR